MIEVGFDVGGTFVDIVIRNTQDSSWQAHKLLIEESVEESVLRAIEEALGGAQALPEQISFVAHGTTLATNIVIEERGARVGLITTAGFRDVLEIGRQERPSIYDSRIGRPVSLVPRDLRLEVDERIGPDGTVLKGLDIASVEKAIKSLVAERLDAVAVCLLHSWKNPIHERQIGAELVKHFPEGDILLSSEVAPQHREYERTTTTVMSTYVCPVLRRYLQRVVSRLHNRGVAAPLWVMQSNGGLASVPEILRRPISAQFSGPAAGVLGALAVARSVGESMIVALDVGGTSTDVTLAVDGQPEVGRERLVRGQPVLDSAIAVHSIGAGGGSVAWVDPGGLLKVGPHSAAAKPGPACYGRGGTEATVTDAHLLLGYIDEKRLLARDLRLSCSLASDAISRLAERLSLSVEDVASGIVSVSMANIVRALRRVTIEGGYDPRDFSLIAYGGGGPLSANLLIDDLQMKRALIPVAAGVLSAAGLLSAGPRLDLVRTHVAAVSGSSLEGIRRVFTDVEAEAKRRMLSQGCHQNEVGFEWQIALRYVGQSHELGVPVDRRLLDPGDLTAIMAKFHAAHEKAFGVSAPSERVESVAVHVIATVGRGPVQLIGTRSSSRRSSLRRWRGPTGWADACVEERSSLHVADVVEGPALIDSDDSTVVVLPGYRARVLRGEVIEITRLDQVDGEAIH